MIHPYFNMTGDEAKGLLYGLMESNRIQLRKRPDMPSVRQLILDGKIRYERRDPEEHWQTYGELIDQVERNGVGYGDCEDFSPAIAAEDRERYGVESLPYAYSPRDGLFHVVVAVPKESYGRIPGGNEWPAARNASVSGYALQDPSIAAGMTTYGFDGKEVPVAYGLDSRTIDDRVVDSRSVEGRTSEGRTSDRRTTRRENRATRKGLGGIFRSFQHGVTGGKTAAESASELGAGLREGGGVEGGWAREVGKRTGERIKGGKKVPKGEEAEPSEGAEGADIAPRRRDRGEEPEAEPDAVDEGGEGGEEEEEEDFGGIFDSEVEYGGIFDSEVEYGGLFESDRDTFGGLFDGEPLVGTDRWKGDALADRVADSMFSRGDLHYGGDSEGDDGEGGEGGSIFPSRYGGIFASELTETSEGLHEDVDGQVSFGELQERCGELDEEMGDLEGDLEIEEQSVYGAVKHPKWQKRRLGFKKARHKFIKKKIDTAKARLAKATDPAVKAQTAARIAALQKRHRAVKGRIDTLEDRIEDPGTATATGTASAPSVATATSSADATRLAELNALLVKQKEALAKVRYTPGMELSVPGLEASIEGIEGQIESMSGYGRYGSVADPKHLLAARRFASLALPERVPSNDSGTVFVERRLHEFSEAEREMPEAALAEVRQIYPEVPVSRRWTKDGVYYTFEPERYGRYGGATGAFPREVHAASLFATRMADAQYVEPNVVLVYASPTTTPLTGDALAEVRWKYPEITVTQRRTSEGILYTFKPTTQYGLHVPSEVLAAGLFASLAAGAQGGYGESNVVLVYSPGTTNETREALARVGQKYPGVSVGQRGANEGVYYTFRPGTQYGFLGIALTKKAREKKWSGKIADLEKKIAILEHAKAGGREEIEKVRRMGLFRAFDRTKTVDIDDALEKNKRRLADAKDELRQVKYGAEREHEHDLRAVADFKNWLDRQTRHGRFDKLEADLDVGRRRDENYSEVLSDEDGVLRGFPFWTATVQDADAAGDEIEDVLEEAIKIARRHDTRAAFSELDDGTVVVGFTDSPDDFQELVSVGEARRAIRLAQRQIGKLASTAGQVGTKLERKAWRASKPGRDRSEKVSGYGVLLHRPAVTTADLFDSGDTDTDSGDDSDTDSDVSIFGGDDATSVFGGGSDQEAAEDAVDELILENFDFDEEGE